MTSSDVMPNIGLDANQIEKAISFNVKIRLAAKGLNQTDLAKYLGVKRSTISVKLVGKSAWSVSDLVNAANFLDATPDELMNDAFMHELGMKKNQDRQGVPVGAGTPRHPVRPKAGNNGTASAGVARPRPFVAMVPPVGLEPNSHDSHPALAASAVPEERESR